MTATEPIRLTPQMVEKMYREHCPEKVERFKEVHAALQDPAISLGTRKEKLQELLQYQVEVEELRGCVLYRWEGSKGTYQLEIAIPFEPNRHPDSVRGSGAAKPLLAVAKEQQEAEEATDRAQPRSEEDAPPPIPQGAGSTQEEVEEAMPEEKGAGGGSSEASAVGLFTALAELLGDTTLLMSISRTGEEQGQPILMVNVVPKGEGDTVPFTPISLEGTVSELDAHFLTAIKSKAESRKRLEEAIAEEKEADRVLAEAKKQEAEVKKKQADAKKKSAEREEEQVRVEEKKAEAVKQQEALF